MVEHPGGGHGPRGYSRLKGRWAPGPACRSRDWVFALTLVMRLGMGLVVFELAALMLVIGLGSSPPGATNVLPGPARGPGRGFRGRQRPGPAGDYLDHRSIRLLITVTAIWIMYGTHQRQRGAAICFLSCRGLRREPRFPLVLGSSFLFVVASRVVLIPPKAGAAR